MNVENLVHIGATATVVATGLGFAFFGLQGFFKPDVAAKKLMLQFTDTSAKTAMRCMYGGFQLGFGILLLVEALILFQLQSALVAIVCLGACLVLTRAYGMVTDKGTNALHRTYLGLEVAMLLSAIALLIALSFNWSAQS